MLGKITLVVETPVASGKAAPAIVTVTGANGRVTIALTQTRGAAPLMARQEKTVDADADGSATVVFDVALEGPSHAVLLATASDDDGPHFDEATGSVEVQA